MPVCYGFELVKDGNSSYTTNLYFNDHYKGNGNTKTNGVPS